MFPRQDGVECVPQRSRDVVDAAPPRGALVAEAVVADEDQLPADDTATLLQIVAELGRRSGEAAFDDDEVETLLAELF